MSLIERCHRYAEMNPKGFRSPRTKPGRVKHPTLMEKLAAEEYGIPLTRIVPGKDRKKVSESKPLTKRRKRRAPVAPAALAPPTGRKRRHTSPEMIERRERQTKRNTEGGTPLDGDLIESLVAIRQANARNGVGRPPSNKVWP